MINHNPRDWYTIHNGSLTYHHYYHTKDATLRTESIEKSAENIVIYYTMLKRLRKRGVIRRYFASKKNQEKIK